MRTLEVFKMGYRACIQGKPADSSLDGEFIDTLMLSRVNEGYKLLQLWLMGYNEASRRI